jgi:hypothetical protein
VRQVGETYSEAICPLCGRQAKKFSNYADWKRYDCPEDNIYEIAGSQEAEAKSNPASAKLFKEHIAQERSRGIQIPRIGRVPD